jgi:uncharacterized protein (DUF4213/DUF364 family)
LKFYEEVREKLNHLVEQNNLGSQEINIVYARKLSPEEAIGNPERKDFPLLKGKEVMMQATFLDARGQAFTDMPGDFQGSLDEVLNLSLTNNFERSVFVATLNAVMRYLKLIDRTVHCRDKEPQECARQLVKYVRQRFGSPRIAFIGLQPAMVESLGQYFPIRVTDLDPENIGKRKCNVIIEDAGATKEIIAWGDIVLATGTTVVNNTIRSILVQKPVVFYGVTVSGIARLKGFEQYCYCGH